MWATALSLAACGGTTLDTASVERDIEEIARDAGDVETDVSCPDEVSDAGKGRTYPCTITFAGNDNNVQTVEMEIVDDDTTSDIVDRERMADEVAIRAIVAETDSDPGAACRHLASNLRQEFADTEDCTRYAVENDDGRPDTVRSVEIEGDTATLVTEIPEGESDESEETTTFRRGARDRWLVTDIE